MSYKATSIAIDNLSFAYNAKETGYVLKNLNFEAKQGEIIVLRGESGTGKSTLLQLIAGCADPNGKIEGKITVTLNGDVIALSDQTKGYRRQIQGVGTGMMFQNPAASFFDIMPVYEQLKPGIIKHLNCSLHQAEKLFLGKLREFNFDAEASVLKKIPSQFSGGELQRIDFAYFDIIQPRIILLDEPVSALDSENWTLIYNAVRSFQQRGAIVLIASHDNDFVNSLGARYFDMKVHEYVYIEDNHTIDASLLKQYIPVKGVDISVDISKTYQDRVLFKDIQFDLNTGRKIVGLSGDSGKGKTTLLQIIAGLKECDPGGKVRFSPGSCKIQMVFQSSPQSFNPAYKIREQIRGISASNDLEIAGLLKIFRLAPELLNKYPGQLSGGQIQRLCFLSAIMESPDLLLLDEPFVGLDAANKKILISVIRTLVQETALRCVITSHDKVALDMLTEDMIFL